MEMIIRIVVALVVLSFYLLPAMIAVGRRHINALPIMLTNLYLGWTIIGWIAALIWGFSQTVVVPAASVAAAYTPEVVKVKVPPAVIAKYAGIAAGVVVLLLAIAFFLTPVSPDAVKARMSGKQTGAPAATASPATTGVPQPASALIGE